MRNLLGLTFFLALIPNILLAQPSQIPLVTVTGEAEVKVAPDQVLLTVGVETAAKTLEVARKDHTARVSQLTEALKKSGVEAKDIQTDFINLEPQYDNYQPSRLGPPDSYVARQTVSVLIRGAEKADTILTTALNSGANNVQGLQFSTSELRKYRDEARRKAMQAAKEKAQLLAKELGQQIDDPFQISEEADSWSGGNPWGGGPRMLAAQAKGFSAEASDAAVTTISPGQISVIARIQVSFRMRKDG